MVVSLVVLSLLGWAQKAPEIPSGTTIKVRLIDRLTSVEARIGDNFHATLEEPIMINDKELYPRGADVTGRVVDVHQSGRLSEPGELDLVLSTVSSGGRTSSLRVTLLVMKGESHGKSNATKIGGGRRWERSSGQLLVEVRRRCRYCSGRSGRNWCRSRDRGKRK